MKKLTVILAALVLALGFTQCKKENNNTEESNGVKITLTVGNTSNTRVDVNPYYNDTYAKVNFEVGDIVYVGYNNAKVGELTCQTIGSDPNINVNATFEGTVNIDDYDGEKPLHFYLLGGKDFVPTFEGNTATVNISDQSTKYPVVSYAVSNEPFTGAGNYTTKMMNKCSILKFNVTKPVNASDAIYINGMNNVVTVDFTDPDGEDNGFSYSMTDYGRIKMRPVVSTTTDPVDMWVIVLPQAELTTTGYAFNEGKTCAGVRPELPEIKSNKYMKEGIDMNLNDLAISVSSVKKVYFAPGNLQYNKNGYSQSNPSATPQWRFAEHQYQSFLSWNYTDDRWVDLFGWGKWTGETKLFETSASGTITVPKPLRYWAPATDYLWDSRDFMEEINGRSDWFTLTQTEWAYLLNTREASTLNGTDNARYAKANVAGVNGLILFPDSYAHPNSVTTLPEYINIPAAPFTSSSYTAEQWDEMEAFGAVFLPVTGMRNVTTMQNTAFGNYWSYSGSDARNISFGANNFNINGGFLAYYGLAVRLVHE